MMHFVPDKVNTHVPGVFNVGVPYDLHLDASVGFGSTAAAYLCEAGDKKCLVKVMRTGDVYESRAWDEYRLLVDLDGAQGHAPVVYAIGRCEDESDGGVRLAMAMEYVEGIDLFTLRRRLENGKGYIASEDVLKVARHLVLGLLHCSVRSKDGLGLATVSHRDLSAGNIRFVLASEGEADAEVQGVVFIDFGQGIESDDPCVTAANGLEHSSTPYVGAPEMFDQQPGGRHHRNESYTDTYSVGCLLYYLRVGDWPLREQIEQIVRRSGGFGSMERQELCDLKRRSVIGMPSELVVTSVDRELDLLLAACTKPGVGILGGRLDVERMAERLGICVAEVIESRDVAVPDETIEPTPLDESPEDFTGRAGSQKLADYRNRLKRRIVPMATGFFALAAVLVVTVLSVMRGATYLSDTRQTWTLTLYPKSSYLSVSQLDDTAELMRARLASVEGASVHVLDSDDGIAVELPRTLVDESKVGQTDGTKDEGEIADNLKNDIKCLLEDPLTLSLVDYTDDGDIVSSKRIYRTDIASVEVVTGPVEGLSYFDYVRDDYKAALRITFTDEASERLKVACGDWFDSASLGIGLGSGNWIEITELIKIDDGSYAFSTTNTMFDDEARILASALMTDEYETDFDCDEVPEVLWETPGSSNETQVNAQSIDEDNAWVIAAISTDGLSEGELVDARAALEGRFGAMGVKYALGTIQDDMGRTGVAVKLAVEGFDASVAKPLLSSGGITLSCGLEECHISSDEVVEAVEDGERTILRISSESDEAKRVLQAAANAGGAWVYVEVGNLSLMRGWVNDASITTIDFTQICLTAEDVDSAHAWLPRLIASLSATSTMPAVSPSYVGKADFSWGGASCALDGIIEQARAAIKRTTPTAKVGHDSYSPSELLVQRFDIELASDGNANELAQRVLDAAQSAYQASDFELSPFSSLTFYCGSENGTKGQVTFTKWRRSYVSSSEPYIEVRFVSADDDLEESLSLLAVNDGFYSNKLAHEASSTT